MKATKVLKWLGVAYLQTFLFCVIVAALIGFFMTLIAYPVQTIVALIVGGILVVTFLFVFD